MTTERAKKTFNLASFIHSEGGKGWGRTTKRSGGAGAVSHASRTGWCGHKANFSVGGGTRGAGRGDLRQTLREICTTTICSLDSAPMKIKWHTDGWFFARCGTGGTGGTALNPKLPIV